jgi:SAM-dependent methyltransferase
VTHDELSAWFDNMREVLETAYVSHTEPWRQSGMSGPEDHDGSFLDIGCANGYLLECCLRWTAERGVRIDPYGLDLSARLVELARKRLPQYAERFVVGNAFEWIPPMRFDYVRTELVYVPGDHEKEYVDFLLEHCVKPGGRLLIANYMEGHPTPEIGLLPGSYPARNILERLDALGFMPVGWKDGFDVVKSRRTRIAILERSIPS